MDSSECAIKNTTLALKTIYVYDFLVLSKKLNVHEGAL